MVLQGLPTPALAVLDSLMLRREIQLGSDSEVSVCDEYCGGGGAGQLACPPGSRKSACSHGSFLSLKSFQAPSHGMGTHSGRSPRLSQAPKDIPGDTLSQSVSCVRLRLMEVTPTLHTKGTLGFSGFPCTPTANQR